MLNINQMQRGRPRKEENMPPRQAVNNEKQQEDQSQNQKLQAIKLAMEQIEKNYGRGSIMKLGEATDRLNVEVISTGSIAVDLALGVGGVPRGRIIEIFGPEASGKTTLTLSIIAECQKQGGTAAFIDAEHALDPLWAQRIGVKLDELLISQPDTGEQALEITQTLIQSGGIDVIVIDSVAALVPRAEIEGEMGDSMMGVQARLMSQALRKLTGIISKSKTVCIFTNQLRQKIGIMFGNPETTPGGLALKFYSSVRLDTRKIDNLKDPSGKIFGSRHRVKVVKNKVAPPFKIAEFDVTGEEGLSKESGVIDVGIEMGVVQKSGAFLKYGETMLGQGKEAAKIFLREKPEICRKIVEDIWKEVQKAKEAPIAMGVEDKEEEREM